MTDQEIAKIAKDYWYPGKGNNDPSFDEIGFARALLSKSIPEGYVVVPKEPTEEMLRESGFRLSYAHEVWEHMIAAAPSVKGEEA